MSAILFSLGNKTDLFNKILLGINGKQGLASFHVFPDKEHYVKIDSDVKNREVIIIESLDKPDHKILPLLFLVKTAKDLGAKRVGLIAPYLAYMRQDAAFKVGESITSRYFANILSEHFDWLMTMDPHLHRYKSLDEIYTIPTTTLHADHAISEWIKKNVQNPFIIGPDAESKQWVEAIAKKYAMPYRILEKRRIGDNKVEINIPDLETFKDHTPVLVDDIISTGATMLGALKKLQSLQMKPAVCIGVHAVFSGKAYESLLEIPQVQIITCNTISHVSNGIDVSDAFIQK